MTVAMRDDGSVAVACDIAAPAGADHAPPLVMPAGTPEEEEPFVEPWAAAAVRAALSAGWQFAVRPLRADGTIGHTPEEWAAATERVDLVLCPACAAREFAPTAA